MGQGEDASSVLSSNGKRTPFLLGRQCHLGSVIKTCFQHQIPLQKQSSTTLVASKNQSLDRGLLKTVSLADSRFDFLQKKCQHPASCLTTWLPMFQFHNHILKVGCCVHRLCYIQPTISNSSHANPPLVSPMHVGMRNYSALLLAHKDKEEFVHNLNIVLALMIHLCRITCFTSNYASHTTVWIAQIVPNFMRWKVCLSVCPKLGWLLFHLRTWSTGWVACIFLTTRQSFCACGVSILCVSNGKTNSKDLLLKLHQP